MDAKGGLGNDPRPVFYRMIPSAPPVDRASRNAQGWLPERAAKYCDAATVASALGWYVYAPMAFSVAFARGYLVWTYGTHEDWFPLGINGAAQFPRFAAHWDAVAPNEMRGKSPPFLTALPEPGMLQIWTGYFVRSSADWSLSIRAPVNIPPHGRYALYDGLVEADRYFSPVFANIILLEQDQPIHFSMNRPLIQVQPVPRTAYASKSATDFDTVCGVHNLSADDWASYQAMVSRKEGAATYAIAARRRRKRED